MRRYDPRLLLGILLVLGGLLSLLDVESLPLSLLSDFVSPFGMLAESPPPLRLSVMYQPEPLKTMPAG